MSAPEAGRRGSIAAFLRAPAVERRLFLRALVLLPIVRLALAALGFRRLTGVLERRSAGSPRAEKPAAERDLLARFSRAVERAARFLPGGASCLERSLLLWFLLRRAGVGCELRIGVRRDDGELAAHAWIEHRGRPVGEHPEVAETYAPFEAPLT